MISVKMIKNLSFKIKIYAAILLLGIIAVFIRIGLVQAERGRSIISFVSEWSRYGRPVTVQEIKAADIPVYTKVTVITGLDKSAVGFVTADIKEKLEQGQAVYSAGKGLLCGVISRIGQELDMDTGMFPVTVELTNLSSAPGSILVLLVQTQTLKNVLVVPNNVLIILQDNYYFWKIEGGKAKRIQVKVGSRNGYGTVINEGINLGDLVVINGCHMLSENDLVRIVPNAALGQADTKDKRL
jgi:hypothetical protein